MMENILKTYDSLDIACYIKDLCKSNKIRFGKTKMNKLMYIAYGIILAEYDHVMTTEVPHYWPQGPVFPHANNKIEKTACNYNLNIDQTTKEIISMVVLNWGRQTAEQLSDWSHEEGSPWDKMFKAEAKYNSKMNNNDIKEYFSKEVLQSHNIPDNYFDNETWYTANSAEELFNAKN